MNPSIPACIEEATVGIGHATLCNPMETCSKCGCESDKGDMVRFWKQEGDKRVCICMDCFIAVLGIGWEE